MIATGKISVMRHVHSIVLLGGLAAALMGCATPPLQPFVYEYSKPKLDPSGSLVLAFSGMADLRTDRNIDKVYANPPVEEVNNILAQEIMSTGLFKDVVRLPGILEEGHKESKLKTADLHLKAALLVMKWEVPNYESIVRNAFVVSLLTGGVGGVMYGSSNTDVFGHARMQLLVKDQRTNVVLIEKEYIGVVKENMIKFQCDTAETKARMVSLAVKDLIEKVKLDLVSTATSAKPQASGQ